MILISLFSLFAIVSSQTQRRSVCLKLESVYESICPSQVESTALRSLQGPPGKVGPNGRVGKPGRQGIKGEKGSAEEANYDRVGEIVSQRIQEVLDEQTRKYSEMSKLLAEANEKIENLENNTDTCPMKYNGKCFWIEYRYPGIAIEQARTICSAGRGRLADIYSSTHHYMLLRYLRMFGSSNGYARAWIGMSYNGNTNTVSLSGGTQAPFVKWYTGYPQSSYSNIYLIAKRDRENVKQHLVNTGSPSMYGAICEK